MIKGRSPTMRNVSRTHRVALDWLLDRINLDPKNPNQIYWPKTNSQTYWPRVISHVTNGIIFCVRLTLAISVLQSVLKWCRKEYRTNEVKKEWQQSRDQWWIWSREAMKGLHQRYLLLHQKAWWKPYTKVKVLWVRKLRSTIERCLLRRSAPTRCIRTLIKLLRMECWIKHTNVIPTNIDHSTSNTMHSVSTAMLNVFEDNEAVIKMIIKGRSPTMRHVSRTHRVALDWLFDRINLDPKFQIRYIDTKHHLADMLSKGSFTRDEWVHLLRFLNIMNFLYVFLHPFSFKQEAEHHIEESSVQEGQEKSLWWQNQSGVNHTARRITDWVGILISQALRNRCETESKTHRRVLKCRTEKSTMLKRAQRVLCQRELRKARLKKVRQWRNRDRWVWCQGTSSAQRKTSPQDSSASNIPANQEFDQSSVSWSARKLVRNNSQDPTAHSQEWQYSTSRPMYRFLDYVCRQQWKPLFILDQITMNIWKYTGTQTSKSSRICWISRSDWHWNMKPRFWMYHRLIGQFPHGRDLRSCTIK